MRTSTLLLTLLLLTSSLSLFPARAQIGHKDFLHPQQPSRNDAVFVSYGLTCGYPVPDPARPPQVVRRLGDFELEVTVDIHLMRDPVEQVCPATPPGPVFALVNIGPIPENIDYVRAIRRVWLVDGTSRTPLDVSLDVVAIGSIPGNSISGLWWSPQIPGALTNLLLASHPGSAYGELIVTTQHFDAEGDLVSMTATGKFDGPEFAAAALIPMRASGASTDVVADTIGMLKLTYLGCRKVLLRFESANTGLASFEQHLEQISWPSGVPGCELNPSFILRSTPAVADTAQ